MTAGRPPKYDSPHLLGITGEKKDHEAFMKICAREGLTPPDKVNEWIKDYNKTHGDGNPQYTIQQFIENEDFKAVPALLSQDDTWRQYADQTNDINELDQVQQKAEHVIKIVKAAKHSKIKAAVKSLKSEGKPAGDRKALPESIDPGEQRKATLRYFFRALQDPLMDRKGGSAHRYRRQRIIDGILRTQVLLPEYQQCQEYLEWLEEQRRK